MLAAERVPPANALSSEPSPTMSALPPIAAIAAIAAIPRLTRNEAQARTLVAQRAKGLPLRLMDSAWLAHITPVVAPEVLPGDAHYRQQWEWAGTQMELHLPTAAVEECVSASLQGASLPALPPDLASAALEAMTADVLQALQALGRGTPQLRGHGSASQAAPLPAHAFTLHLQATESGQAITGLLYTDGLGLLMLAGLLAQRPPVQTPLHTDTPIRLHAEIGSTLLPADTLATLAPADVLLMDRCLATPGRALWLSADGRSGVHVHWPAPEANAPAAAPLPFTVITPWTDTMPTDTDSSASPAPMSLDSVPVRLSFDLGEVTLTLGQLQALQPGQALELGHPLAGAVRIRANGALVGEGDLIEIDGQVGVSIRHLFNAQR
jgi:type III secretion protein Q